MSNTDLTNRDANASETTLAQRVLQAEQAAKLLRMALNKAQLRVQRMRMINHIVQMTASTASSLGIDAILRNTLQTFQEFLRPYTVGLFLLDPDDPTVLVLREQRGIYGDEVTFAYRQPITQGIIGSAVRSGARVLVNNVRHDESYIPIPGAEKIYAELAIPITYQSQVLGVINIESEFEISEQDADDLQLVADQLGVAIERAHQLEAEKQRHDRLALIARMGQRAATRLDSQTLFKVLVDELHKQLGYDHAALFLMDPDAPDWLVQRACATRWPPAAAIGYRQHIDKGVVGMAARKREPELVNDIGSATHYISMATEFENSEPRAELAVPILAGDRLLGVLDLASLRVFTKEDVVAAQIVADQIAIALDNAALLANMQRALFDAQLLYTTMQRTGEALSELDVINAYLEHVAAREQYSCSIVTYETDHLGRRVFSVLRGRWTPHEGITHPSARIDFLKDNFDEILDTGRTVTVTHVANDARVPERLRQMQLQEGRPSLAMIPLMMRGERIGLVILTMPVAHHWDDGELRIYQTTAATLAQAIDHRRQQRLVYDRGQQVAILEERQRLARELHDSVTQLIFSTTLIAQSVSAAYRRSVVEGEQRVTRMLELSQAALAEMRALLQELRLPLPRPFEPERAQAMPTLPGLVRLQRDGLVAAIESYANDVKRDEVTISVDAHGYWLGDESLRPPMKLEETLFRVAQEALNNVMKHAHAHRVHITLGAQDQIASLEVRDDGFGFDIQAEWSTQDAKSRGIGLQTMRERVEAQHGHLQITSAVGQGTTLVARIPWQEREKKWKPVAQRQGLK